MPRNMSVAFTEQQVRDRTKTVTRRRGWWENKNGRRLLKPGDRLSLVRKGMGLKPGEEIVRVADVEVVSVEREELAALTMAPAYGAEEMAREGFPGMDPVDFIQRYFVEAQGMDPLGTVTRIEWRYLDSRQPRVWHRGDEEPPDRPQVRDVHGDVWTHVPGTFEWTTPETQNCAWSFIARKFAPLTEVLTNARQETRQ